MQPLSDFVRLTKTYGHVGIQISHPHELKSKPGEVLEQVCSNRLVFVDVTVDGSEHIYPIQIRGGGMDEMWLSKTERTRLCTGYYQSYSEMNQARYPA